MPDISPANSRWYYAPDTKPVKIIDLKNSCHHPVKRSLMTWVEKPLEKFLSLDGLNRTYAEVAAQSRKDDFFKACLDTLRIRYTIHPVELDKIPSRGPLVVVANHPFGAIEAVLLGDLLKGIRPDYKFLGNYLLHHIPELREKVIAVDPFGNKLDAPLSNIKGLKHTLKWLKDGGALVVFPAGEVSHLYLKKGRVIDAPWIKHVAGVIRFAKATVLPVYFSGRNSILFQLMGLIHPRLRTALLPRELLKKSDQMISLTIGNPIFWRKLKRINSDESMIHYLRIVTYMLSNQNSTAGKMRPRVPFMGQRSVVPQPLIAPIEPSVLEHEIGYLPPQQRLLENDHYAVYLAESTQIPQLLNEIGRLREKTFRDIGEGTGNAIDLDRFDSYYLHLFLWDKKQAKVAGAYRIGTVKAILKKFGPSGLYTASLFRFKRGFLYQLGNALEMGRSFICTQYQKKHESLFLLWRGIAEFILRHPQYNTLFGPVSISQKYHTVSKNLMIQFLKDKKLDQKLSRYVTARHPFRTKRVKRIDNVSIQASIQDIDDVSVLISEIEADGKGMPSLLRHYLNLNARLLSFNVDKTFSNVVDGLILVDLTQTDPRLLKRFMGAQGVKRFLAYHGFHPEFESKGLNKLVSND
jgi:putative hemolysin